MRIFLPAIIVIFSGLFALQAAPRIVGRINSLKGEVDLVTLDSRERKTPKAGMAVYDNEQIRTGMRSKVSISLIDNSRLEIFEISVVNIKLLGNHDEDPLVIPISVRMLSGKVRMQVSKLVYAEKKFFLKTPTLVAAAKGTDFSCVATLTDARLAVAEGAVEVGNRSTSLRNSYVLTARQEVRVQEGREPENLRFLPVNVIENYLENYEITSSQRIRKRIREPETLIDKMLKKKDY